MFSTTPTTQTLSKRAAALRERMNEQHRVDLARDMGTALNEPDLSATERTIAQEIVAKLVEDEITNVRAAIAEAVAGSPHLPGTIASKLAHDISEVAIPVLSLSPVLEDRVLEDIIDSGATDKIRAIAGREIVSPNICRRIVASGKKGAVIRLLENPGASLTNQTMITIVRVYGDDQNVEKAVLDRGELPDEVVSALCELVEAHVVAFVQRYFNLPEHVVNVQKGRNLLKGIKTKRRAIDNKNWWDTKKGVI
ncbi:DUF2336 domain-containing protein [Terasakiella sp. A23]|uniref:DUF2336 domain-containing protein n=1 Tax=Terasakiella sp. FCG-A23 TaxID=3080561 RepID=UPI002952B168|nr:DUF2336 domain-containing protein [Terasakiella sp. A23]MDV7339837.1 DUF2336 domain-containing protein [Terasakiella sp. A23]